MWYFALFGNLLFVSSEAAGIQAAVPYPQKVPCPGPKAEIKMLNGSPAFYLDGKTRTGLMGEETKPRPYVENGRLVLTCLPNWYTNRSLTANCKLDGPVVIEAAVAVREVFEGGANVSIQASAGRSFYFLGLEEVSGERCISFLKYHRDYERWFNIPFNWETGRLYRLKMVIDGNKISAFVDGNPVAEKEDLEEPLPVSQAAFSVFHTCSTVDDIRISTIDGKVLFEDDFTMANPKLWRGDLANPGQIKTLGPPESGMAFSGQGVHIYLVTLDFRYGVWYGPNAFNFSSMDKKFKNILESDAEARFLIRWRLLPPDWWINSHTDEEVLDSNGKALVSMRFVSYPSETWREEGGEAVRQVIRHHNSSTFGERIIGYNLDYGRYEWLFESGERFYDYSEVSRRTFRGWLKARYGTDDGLQKSWRDKSVTLNTADIPTAEERRQGDFYNFKDPARGANKVADYLQFNAESVSDLICFFAKAIKEETDRKRLTLFFFGYHIPADAPVNYNSRGHHAMLSVLESPDVDALCAPFQYRERQPGGMSMYGSGVAGSMRLHGKFFWGEDDTRTHISGENTSYGRTNTAEETVNVHKRNFAYALSEAESLWWVDWGLGWLEDRATMENIGRIEKIGEESLRRDRSRNAEIAVIVSQRSHFFLKADSNTASLLNNLMPHQVYNEMSRIGAPFDMYLIEDIARIPQYKLYIFLDTFYMTDEQRKTVMEKVRREHATALWIFAPGYVTEEGFSKEAMAELTGIELEPQDAGGQLSLYLCDFDHPITRRCPPGLRFGVDRHMGPIIKCADNQADVLGMYAAYSGTHPDGTFKTGMEYGPGLAVKENGSWRSIWCGVPNLPASLLRGIAEYAGVHVYSDSEDFLCANKSMLSIHARYAGKRTIKLPVPVKVVDAFSGEVVSEKTTSFSVNLEKYETKMWWLESN